MCALVVCTKADKGVTAIKGAQRVDVGVKNFRPLIQLVQVINSRQVFYMVWRLIVI